MKSEFIKLSALHNIKPGAPPTIVFLGINDKIIPGESAQKFKQAMEKVVADVI